MLRVVLRTVVVPRVPPARVQSWVLVRFPTLGWDYSVWIVCFFSERFFLGNEGRRGNRGVGRRGKVM